MPELQNPFIIGERCYLRAVTEADLEGDYFQWMNDFEVTRYMEGGRYPNTPAQMRAYWETAQADHGNVFLAICDKSNNRHIGNIALHHIHPIHRRAELGMMIGDKTYWGKGYATEAVFLTVDYGFRRLNLRSIFLGVVESNQAAVRVYEKVGFRIEGTHREAWWADGKWHNTYTMSILAREHFARLEEQQK